MKSSRFPDTRPRPDETIDALLGGRLKLLQSRQGYRFSVDALFLAEFVTVRPGELLVDLGTGCGVIPLILLLTKPLKQAFGIEVQHCLACQASRNAYLNDLSGKMKIVLADIRHLPLSRGMADIVICNPPYRKVNSGRINPDTSKAIARHEILVSLEDILKSARYLAKEKGRFAIIYPAERLGDLLSRARSFNLEPKRIQIVYPGIRSSAKLVLVEAVVEGNPGLEILPPILGQGNYSVSTPA